MIDHSMMKLGKRAPIIDRRTLRLAKYLVKLPPIPAAVDWTHKIKKLGMMKNDVLGDCTCAAAGHAIQTWTANVKKEITPTDKQIVSAYSAVTGYNPKNPNSDQGAVELDVLNYWRKTGIGGHKISSYMSCSPKNVDHVRASIYLFGGVYIGLALPITAQKQDVWDETLSHGDGAPGSWGGHAVWVCAFTKDALTCVTWGGFKQLTWKFWNYYCDESYALLSTDWVSAIGTSPSGFNLAALQTDLSGI